VCVDISIVALQEARKRIGGHGLYVVADIANLPFKAQAFDGVVTLHTIHHLPEGEHLQAYRELYRLLAPGSSAAVVNGWPSSRLMRFFEPALRLSNRLRSAARRLTGQAKPAPGHNRVNSAKAAAGELADGEVPKAVQNTVGTFTNRHDVPWIKEQVGRHMPVEILVWRSVSVRFMRGLIHPWLGGRLWLRLLYWLEDRYPRYFGENGQYPIIVIRKP
jgi:hypothetical protein